MILLPLEQGSEAWKKARLGIPTASQFHRIVTPKKMEYASAVTKYRNELLAEWLLGEPVDGDFSSGYMERGTSSEKNARDFYELQREVDLLPGGFILRDDRRAGCSPDGLIGETGGLEMKTPNAPNHVGFLLDGIELEYRAQIQGGIAISERDWWDFLSYNPLLPTVLVRVPRDDIFIAKLTPLLNRFCDELDAAKETLARYGYTPGNPDGPGRYETLLEKLERSVKPRPAFHEIAGLG